MSIPTKATITVSLAGGDLDGCIGDEQLGAAAQGEVLEADHPPIIARRAGNIEARLRGCTRVPPRCTQLQGGGMAILVTGGSGYVGLNVVEALARAGREVVSFDMTLPPAVAAVELSALPGKVHAVDGDLMDAGALDRAFRAAPIEAVIHTAAVTSGPAREAAEPARVFQVNVLGTIGLLEAARRASVRRVVITSSGAAYGESLYRPGLMDEDATPVLPTTLYATTKYAAERAARRLAEFGPNHVEEVDREPVLLSFAREFTHFFAIILWIARSRSSGLRIW